MTGQMIAAAGSVTAAMQAERVLLAAGIACEVVALEPHQTRRGCAFGVAFSAAQDAAARHALRAAHVFVSQYIKG